MSQPFVPHAKPPKGIIQPGEGPFDDPALGDPCAVDQVGAAPTTALTVEGALRNVHSDLALVEHRPKRATVVALICDQAPGALAPSNPQAIQRGDRAAQIVVGRGHDGERQRDALGIDDQGPLRPVETDLAGRADGSAPFFAGTTLASSMACSSRSLSWRLSITRRAAQSRSQVPSRIQWLRRR